MPPTEGRPRSSRFDPRWLWLLAAALLAARVTLGVWDRGAGLPERTPARHGDGGEVAWVAIADAESAAARLHRPILYDFSAAWCGPCQRLDREVFANQSGARLISSLVVPVRVLDRQREEGRNPPAVSALQQRFQVDAFPTLVLYSPAQRRYEAMRGFAGAPQTLQWLTAAAKMLRSGGGTPAP